MNTPLSWLKAYVPDLCVTAQEYTDKMTMSGTKVEGHVELDKNLSSIVVGQIKKVEKHPNADKLKVCIVDIGSKDITLVTGAPNITVDRVGAKIPVVLDGGHVAAAHGSENAEQGISIHASDFRGVRSEGMMCSIEELGGSKDLFPEAPELGIYIFQNHIKAEPGDDAVEVLGLHDVVFEHEITSNRVDCYSVMGIAREAAATFDKAFIPPVPEAKGSGDVHDYASVEIVDQDLCPKYCARVVKNIKLAPSPEWMQKRLRASGHRPINNLVDITNYVMDEYGQPMHAFDLDTVSGHKIVVRRAKDGDTFTTLDGQARKLDKDILMICDGEKEIGIAGIMGGENSKITDSVKTVLFESACFDGTNNRLSAKRLGLRTDASAKYEKGLDPNNCQEAIDRACQLVEELGCGEVVAGTIDISLPMPKPLRIPLRYEKINALLGTDISKEDMISYLKKVELTYDESTEEIIVPTFRQDVEREADLAEEVARFFGYDKIPSTLPSGGAIKGGLTMEMRVQSMIRDSAEYCGYSQSMTYSFESPKVFEKLALPEDSDLRKAIAILNPLGEDFRIMRTSLLNGLLASLSINYNRRNKDVKLYEISRVYLPKTLPLTELPDERPQCILGFYGKGDFFELKGAVEAILKKIGMKKPFNYSADSGLSFLHPGRQANIIYEGAAIGYMGEVHPTVLKAYDIGERAYVANLDLPDVMPFVNFDYKYEGLAKYPAVLRDISMVMKKEVSAGQVEAVIRKAGTELLESIQLFDIYEGDQIEEGYKSMAYNISFRDKDKTLEEKEINGIMDTVVQQLKAIGVNLRG